MRGVQADGSSRVLVQGLAILLTACGGGIPVLTKGDAGGGNVTGRVSGWVVKGPVSAGQVTAYRLDSELKRGDPLATGTTDENGAYSLDLPSYQGPLLVVASTGTYVEEAIDKQVSLGGTEMTAVIKDYKPGAGASGMAITPISHMAYRLAVYSIVTEQRGFADAIDSAYDALDHHFGDLDWRTTRPSTFGQLAGGSQLSPADRAGLILAAFSQEAKAISDRASLTPGTIVNALSLTQALADDLAADGFFDGKGGTGDITLPPGVPFSPNSSISASKLDGQTTRLTLASALSTLLNGPRNTTPLTFQDARIFTGDLSRDSDRRIFRDDGIVFASQAPTLSVTTPPTRFTQGASASFSVTVTDTGGAGIKGVHALLQGVTYNATLANGQWSFSGIALSAGYNPIAVYAEDLAGNSGLGQPEPFQVVVPVTKDNSAPTPFLTPFASYVSEQHLGLQVDGSGVPAVPPIVQVPSGDVAKVSLVDGNDVFKAATRLSWGSQAPTGGDLEGQTLQGSNTPFVQFVFNTVPDDAPIATVTFTVTPSCNGCPSMSATMRAAVPAARTAPNSYYVDVPLSAETVPALLTAQRSPIDLQVEVTATDAAGNVSSSAGATTIHFHVLGAPLAVADDGSYAAAGDTRSVFPYKLAGVTYATLWTSGGAFSGGTRVARYLVRNPFPVAVPIALPSSAFTGAAWNANERWATAQLYYSEDGSASFDIAGTQYPETYFTDACAPTNFSPVNALCGRDPAATNQILLKVGAAGFSCPASSAAKSESPGALTAVSSGAPGLAAYKSPQPSGGETTPADGATDVASSPFAIVPAASASGPGVIVLYVTRPFVSRSYTLTTFSAHSECDGTSCDQPPVPGYRVYVQDQWLPFPMLTSVYDPDGNYCLAVPTDYLSHSRIVNKLAAANETLAGTLNFTTAALSGPSAVMSDSARFIDSRVLNITVPH